MSRAAFPVQGAGLGLRRSFLFDLEAGAPAPGPIGFWEVAPENWIGVGGRAGRHFRAVIEHTPLLCHGLTLNLGGFAPLDEAFLRQVRRFLDEHHARCYGDHLSYCADEGQLYELLPIPFTGEAVHHVAGRIRRAQEILERRLVVENPAYYCAPGQEMAEIDFINAVLREADCDLLIDINNIYVNSVNHGYDPVGFIERLPGERIAYGHIAGHLRAAEDLIVDTHGADVIDPVWALLDLAYRRFGVFPTLVERDFNIPVIEELLREVRQVADLQARCRVAPERVAHG